MGRRRTAARAVVRASLSRSLGKRRARVAYDTVSASRELLWNSVRRRLYPSFWRRALRDRQNDVLRYAIHGEFGDALLALPFLYSKRRQCPQRRLEVLIKSSASGTVRRSADDAFSEGRLRLMAAPSGGSVNFLAEFWSQVGFVDGVQEGDVEDPRHHYWQPQPAIGLRGHTVGPGDYRPFLGGMFTDEDRRAAQEIWARSERPIRVAVHLRRSAEQIAALIDELDRSEFGASVVVALLGSRGHETIPNLSCNRVELLDLTDNYEKGISIMPLLQTLRTADLFIGGRGGFELFALVAAVPAITVFGEDGWWERRRLWPLRLWSENPLGVFLESANFEPKKVFQEHVGSWLALRAEVSARRDVA